MHPSRPTLRLILLISAFILPTLGGCASTYYGRYDYRPAPAEATIDREEQPVRTYATVRGVRRATTEPDRPAAVEVRFLIQNESAQPATIPPDSLRLVPADLRPLDGAIIEDGEPTAPPHGETTFAALFPLPVGSSPSDHDLSGLSMRWVMRVGDIERSQNVSFARHIRRYRSYPRSSFHFGYPYHHHSWHYGYSW